MPELPEVEVVRAGLEPAITGATIVAVEIFDERSLRRHDGSPHDFATRLTGRSIETPRRRGKFLWLPLAERRVDTPERTTSEALVVHLGMSGQVLLRTPDAPVDRLTR